MSDPYGMIDLSTLRHDAPAADAGEPGVYEIAVTEQGLEQVIADSDTVATLLVVTSSRVPRGAEFLAVLRRLVDAQRGVLRLATVDADTQPRVAGALRVQNLPTALLLLRGQIQPLFEGAVAEAELAPVLDQVAQLAASQGLPGLAAGDEAPAEEDEPLSPLEQAAYDAIQSGDLDAAVAAYQSLLNENPADAEAKAGLATVHLMQRTQGADLDAARTTGAERPGDLEAQLLVADLDVLGGHVDDAFARLLDQLRGADEETRDAVRTRLLELFEVVGAEDPRVAAARRRMANLLY
ncbi:tetratricopeptide repeat protein [Brachybacterium huguangmaarense]|uniref:Tetratricopeptide repeat protein n=1 Tax=Brachybacterium huguangmaarense TaxID=1652028 RepID=A0ABY6FYI8_9MICO|nr:tetratricopeptide repeat protein [Brachybacterium huguangmaarense]UYG15985.1 tetratricopeptide repeat protein [Brachybacterium huguangmaarense]